MEQKWNDNGTETEWCKLPFVNQQSISEMIVQWRLNVTFYWHLLYGEYIVEQPASVALNINTFAHWVGCQARFCQNSPK